MRRRILWVVLALLLCGVAAFVVKMEMDRHEMGSEICLECRLVKYTVTRGWSTTVSEVESPFYRWYLKGHPDHQHKWHGDHYSRVAWGGMSIGDGFPPSGRISPRAHAAVLRYGRPEEVRKFMRWYLSDNYEDHRRAAEFAWEFEGSYPPVDFDEEPVALEMTEALQKKWRIPR